MQAHGNDKFTAPEYAHDLARGQPAENLAFDRGGCVHLFGQRAVAAGLHQDVERLRPRAGGDGVHLGGKRRRKAVLVRAVHLLTAERGKAAERDREVRHISDIFQDIVHAARVGGRQQQRGVGGQRQAVARNAERGRVVQRLRLAQGNAVGQRKRLCHIALVFFAEDRPETVAQHEDAKPPALGQPDDRGVIEQRACGRRVLQQVAAAADEQPCRAHLAQDGGDVEARHGAHAVFFRTVFCILAEEGDRHVGRTGADARHQRRGDGVVARVAEAVVAADKDPARHVRRDGGEAFVHRLVVERHPRGGEVLENDAAAVVAHRAALVRRAVEERAEIGIELCLGGLAAVAAAVVGLQREVAAARVHDADVALVARDDGRQPAAHRLERRAGRADEDVGRREERGRVGAKPRREDDLSPVLPLQRVGDCAHVGEQIPLGGQHAVAHDHDFEVGVLCKQPLGAPGKAELRLAAALVHAADRDDAVRRRGEGKLVPDSGKIAVRRKAVGVDAVDRDRDVVGKLPVVVDEILLDVLADRHLAVAPVGEAAPQRRHAEDPVRRGDEAEMQFLLQRAADERGDARVRVNHVKMPVRDQLFQRGAAAQHRKRIFRMQRHGDMADAGGLQHVGVAPASRGDRHGVAVAHERAAELVDVRLRTAEAHLHRRHEDVQFLAFFHIYKSPLCGGGKRLHMHRQRTFSAPSLRELSPQGD